MNFEVSLSVEENGKKSPKYTLETDLNGEITFEDLLKWTKSALIITADQVLKEEQSKGFDKKPVLVVDGKINKPVLSVSPLGQIEFLSRQNMSDIVIEAYDALLHRSKVLTGRYKSSHFVFYNGRQIATDDKSLKAWFATNPPLKQNDTIRIVNIQPYARRLERFGVTAQRTQSRKVDSGGRKKKTGTRVLTPNGTYFLTARAMKSKYKRNTNIRFTFLSGASIGISGSFKKGRKGKNSSGRPYLFPTLVFTVQERGLL